METQSQWNPVPVNMDPGLLQIVTVPWAGKRIHAFEKHKATVEWIKQIWKSHRTPVSYRIMHHS